MVHHLVSTWAEYTPALVISRPSAEGTNRSKLYQATEILACGFRYPESLVTNDPAEIRNFARRRRRVIYKSMSNVRSIVKALSIDDLEGKKLGPVFFQHLIEGQNVRVHVVGEDCFACAIDTDGVDYRYASSYMRPVQLPPEVRNKAVALTRKLQLVLAGIDLILADTGDWYCLEVNPNPGFASFHDGDLIADAVAHLLLQADRASSASA
jgi:glutathione synthase/RimK-type ligase-like ATP-grasp enzyme